MRRINILGIPLDDGAGQPGCRFGPTAFRRAGLPLQLRKRGLEVEDMGDVRPGPTPRLTHPNPAVRRLGEIGAWLEAIGPAADRAGAAADVPVFLGGDHALSAATVPAMARRATQRGRRLFVLWLDAHPDLHDLDSTDSGNLHGVPVAYFTGRPGFTGFPPLAGHVAPGDILQLGLRSIDKAEMVRLRTLGIAHCPGTPGAGNAAEAALAAFLSRVKETGGDLHVSFDVDFLDPALAPGVGTAVPRGAGRRAALGLMRRIHDSGCLTSLDLVELNPRLDRGDATAQLMTALAAAAFGAADQFSASMTGS